MREHIYLLNFDKSIQPLNHHHQENQDGGVGRHTASPRTTRTDRKSNGREVRHQVDKKETYIQTGRWGGDRDWGREDSRGCGRTKTGGVRDEWGRHSNHWKTLWLHIHAQINRTNGGEQSRLCNPGLQRGEIKPQTSD